jgi:endonuclease/exonuclease/phosphatase family metal-dependent hydrolase
VRRRVQNILRWSNLLLVLLTLLAYLSPTVDPRSTWQFSMLGLLFPLLFFANLFFIVVWLFLKRWNFLLSLACLLLGWGSIAGFFQFGGTTKLQGQAGTVLTHNIMFGKGLADRNSAPAKVADFLNAQNPDIFCLQEFFRTKNDVRQFTEQLHIDYKYHYPTNQYLFIGSKYPVIQTGEIAKANNNINGCIFADLNVNGQRIRVYNLHLLSNNVTDLAEEVARKGELQEKETWGKVGNMFRYYKRAAQQRVTQAAEIAAHIEQCPYPVLVCGDFNDVPLSFTYRLFAQKLQDSFREQGSGLGTTYAGNIPWLRIDYILAGQQATFLAHDVPLPSPNYSDHYPVWAQVEWGE